MKRGPLVIALLAGASLAGIGLGVGLSPRVPAPDVTATPVPVDDEPPAAPVAAWCAPSLEPVAGDGCYAAPPGDAAGAPLVVYLHGMYERTAGKAEELERQTRVATRARARGFAVLALHGKEGECTARPELATWFCWPSNERTAGDADAFVAAWKAPLDAVAKRGGGRGKRYVLGFSNGAFFAGLVAQRALFAADAFVVAHGGPVQPVRAAGTKPPLLLMSADDDPSQEGMIYLDALLAREGWPHDTYARAGGHALTEADVDAALTFFTRVATEAVPLRPPLTEHRPVLHRREDAATADATSHADEPEAEEEVPDEAAPDPSP
jgi:poly(3-hydroxybutyrate) depolymerase